MRLNDSDGVASVALVSKQQVETEDEEETGDETVSE